jgi:para-nitrobenzyl esterase
MQDYWTNFAKTYDPNGTGAVAWPQFTTAGDEHLLLAAETKVGTGLKKDMCDFWDQTPIPFP